MFKDNYNKKYDPTNTSPVVHSSNTEKLTALWALSESALGGVLHAVRFPFRGIFISSAAVILISSIASFSYKRSRIIKTCVTVIGAKAVISPHTPVTAHLSVFLQGLLGEIFFAFRKFKYLSTVLFSIIVQLLNGFQKIIVLTLIFGAALWRTINNFLNYIIEEWFFIKFSGQTDYSYLIISFYIGIHLIAGFIVGIVAYRIPVEIKMQIDKQIVNDFSIEAINQKLEQKRKSEVRLKLSSVLIIIMSVTIIVASYFYPIENRFDVTAVLLMLIRAVAIIFVWFYIISPLISRFLRNKLVENKNNYNKEISEIVNQLPFLKTAAYTIWKSTSEYSGFKRIYHFIVMTLAYALYEKNSPDKE